MSKALRPRYLAPLVLTLSGCSRTGPQAVPVKAIDAYVSQARVEGVSVGAEPYDTYKKSNDAFGAWVSREFTPVQLVVENGATDKILIQRNKTKLTCDDGTTLEPVSALAMFEPFRQHVSGFALLTRSGVATMAADSNERTKSDWMQKEFPAETILTTGGRASGFLYFRGTCSYRRGRQLHVTADKMSSNDTVPLSFELR